MSTNNPCMQRRRLLILAAAEAPLCALPCSVTAQPRSAAGLRVGVDTALMQSGFAVALQRAFSADTGIAAQLVGLPALPLLRALEQGEVDVALANAPAAEAQLEQQGLVHDWREIAQGEFVLVGPRPAGQPRGPALLAGARGLAEALQRIAAAASADPGALRFLSAGDGSGTHVLEQAVWRAAQVAPAAPWYVAADPKAGFVAQLRTQAAFGLVERAAWAVAGGGAPLLAGDPLGLERIHVMRSFRVSHPAGKMFVAWLAAPTGRRVVGGLRGYQRPAG